MLLAIYARSANEDDVIRQVEDCMGYILENWGSKPQVKLFSEIVEGVQTLENCLELQKLLKQAGGLDAVVVAHPLCFFSHIIDESFSIYKTIGRLKLHYAINHFPNNNNSR